MKRILLSLLVLATYGVAFGAEKTAQNARQNQIEQVQKEIESLTSQYQDLQEKAQSNSQDTALQKKAIDAAVEIQALQAKLTGLKGNRK